MDLLQEWKERLGLQDWGIKLNIDCKHEDMKLEKCAGCNEWEESIKCARIDILSKEEYGDRILEWDFERILVHELLHLKFSLLDDSRWNTEDWMPDRFVHQLIDDMARALVCAKRGTLKVEIKESD